MPRKRYKEPTNQQNPLTMETKLPTNQPIAIYYRQSTEAQVGNISTTLQTVDMVKYLKQQGWSDENIIMIDMDAGISGTTKIDERPGMSKLFSLITQNKIGAVACQDEDRLFRDVTQIQVNIFIEACREHKVLVMTPSMVYNFAQEQLGTFHARQFRFKSEMAAEYISTVIKGKLLSAKRSLLHRGKWAGSPVPVGFMVDMRKTLLDGSKNENWRQYELFEPYAEVVREYFRLFISYSGCLKHTLTHIQKHGPFFPDPTVCLPPQGYRVVYKIKLNKHGWCLKSVHALGQLLTHAAYAGHWVIEGSVVKWHNHPPIVDEATFFKAFNYLSPIDLNGKKNPHYKSYALNSRPTLEVKRDVDRPLCAGMIFSFWEGRRKAVGANWKIQHKCYNYVFAATDGYGTVLWQKRAYYIDNTVSAFLLEKLKLTFNYDTWQVAVDSSLKEFEERRNLKKSQLKQLETVMENLVISLSSLSLSQMIAAVEEKYQAAQEEFNRLQSELSVITSDEAKMQKLMAIKNDFGNTIERWTKMTMDEKREVIRAFVDRIEITQEEDRKLFMKIFWRDGSTDGVRLGYLNPYGVEWLPQHVEQLITLIESGASKMEIAQAFPDRKWQQIAQKYRNVTKKSLNFHSHGLLRKYESYNEYVARAGINGEHDATSCVGSPINIVTSSTPSPSSNFCRRHRVPRSALLTLCWKPKRKIWRCYDYANKLRDLRLIWLDTSGKQIRV